MRPKCRCRVACAARGAMPAASIWSPETALIVLLDAVIPVAPPVVAAPTVALATGAMVVRRVDAILNWPIAAVPVAFRCLAWHAAAAKVLWAGVEMTFFESMTPTRAIQLG